MRPISGLSALSGMTARDGLSSPRQAGSGARFLGLRDGLSCATPSRPGPLRFDEQELQEGVQCSHRAHFSAPAKRLRAEHRRPRAERRPHGQFRPQRRKSRPLRSTRTPHTGRSGRGRSPTCRPTRRSSRPAQRPQGSFPSRCASAATPRRRRRRRVTNQTRRAWCLPSS